MKTFIFLILTSALIIGFMLLARVPNVQEGIVITAADIQNQALNNKVTAQEITTKTESTQMDLTKLNIRGKKRVHKFYANFNGSRDIVEAALRDSDFPLISCGVNERDLEIYLGFYELDEEMEKEIKAFLYDLIEQNEELQEKGACLDWFVIESRGYDIVGWIPEHLQ